MPLEQLAASGVAGAALAWALYELRQHRVHREAIEERQMAIVEATIELKRREADAQEDAADTLDEIETHLDEMKIQP